MGLNTTTNTNDNYLSMPLATEKHDVTDTKKINLLTSESTGYTCLASSLSAMHMPDTTPKTGLSDLAALPDHEVNVKKSILSAQQNIQLHDLASAFAVADNLSQTSATLSGMAGLTLNIGTDVTDILSAKSTHLSREDKQLADGLNEISGSISGVSVAAPQSHLSDNQADIQRAALSLPLAAGEMAIASKSNDDYFSDVEPQQISELNSILHNIHSTQLNQPVHTISSVSETPHSLPQDVHPLPADCAVTLNQSYPVADLALNNGSDIYPALAEMPMQQQTMALDTDQLELKAAAIKPLSISEEFQQPMISSCQQNLAEGLTDCLDSHIKAINNKLSVFVAESPSVSHIEEMTHNQMQWAAADSLMVDETPQTTQSLLVHSAQQTLQTLVTEIAVSDTPSLVTEEHIEPWQQEQTTTLAVIETNVNDPSESNYDLSARAKENAGLATDCDAVAIAKTQSAAKEELHNLQDTEEGSVSNSAVMPQTPVSEIQTAINTPLTLPTQTEIQQDTAVSKLGHAMMQSEVDQQATCLDTIDTSIHRALGDQHDAQSVMAPSDKSAQDEIMLATLPAQDEHLITDDSRPLGHKLPASAALLTETSLASLTELPFSGSRQSASSVQLSAYDAGDQASFTDVPVSGLYQSLAPLAEQPENILSHNEFNGLSALIPAHTPSAENLSECDIATSCGLSANGLQHQPQLSALTHQHNNTANTWALSGLPSAVKQHELQTQLDEGLHSQQLHQGLHDTMLDHAATLLADIPVAHTDVQKETDLQDKSDGVAAGHQTTTADPDGADGQVANTKASTAQPPGSDSDIISQMGYKPLSVKEIAHDISMAEQNYAGTSLSLALSGNHLTVFRIGKHLIGRCVGISRNYCEPDVIQQDIDSKKYYCKVLLHSPQSMTSMVLHSLDLSSKVLY
ncbi:hypothetical protein PT286_00395 [Neisseriaceae bacterium ESL0693]|nr:hypothetical protein [Neisseriaceae bacterium ESL0693]